MGFEVPPVLQALCTADISDMVAAVTNGPAAGVATTSDCASPPVPEDECPVAAVEPAAGYCWFGVLGGSRIAGSTQGIFQI